MLASLLLNEPVPGRRVIYGVWEEEDREETPVAEVRARPAPSVLTKFHKPEYIRNFFATAEGRARRKRDDDAILALILTSV